jgi:N-acetylmuramoyl-L-alanine amidase
LDNGNPKTIKMRTMLKMLILLFLKIHPNCFGQSDYNTSIVIIDPEHGGVDSGAVGPHGAREKKIVLKVAKEMVRLNRELFDNSLEIYLSRYSDTLISLSDRTRFARALSPRVFVSIHCNLAPRAGAQGVEVFVPRGRGKFSKESMSLATEIGQNLNQYLGMRFRGVKAANFQVLRGTVPICPSVLVELGFLSNGVEADHMKKVESLTGFALALLNTLITIYHE